MDCLKTWFTRVTFTNGVTHVTNYVSADRYEAYRFAQQEARELYGPDLLASAVEVQDFPFTPNKRGSL